MKLPANPYAESKTRNGKLPVYLPSFVREAEVERLLEPKICLPVGQLLSPRLVLGGVTSTVVAVSMALRPPRLLRSEVEAADSVLAQGEPSILTKTLGPTLSTISRNPSSFLSSISSSARRGAKSMLAICRIWICATRRKRARCISLGKGL